MKNINKQSGGVVAAVIIILLMLGLIAAGVFMYFYHKNNTANIEDLEDKIAKTRQQLDSKEPILTSSKVIYKDWQYSVDVPSNWQRVAQYSEKGVEVRFISPDDLIVVKLRIDEAELGVIPCNKAKDRKIRFYNKGPRTKTTALESDAYIVESVSESEEENGFIYKIGLTPYDGASNTGVGSSACVARDIGHLSHLSYVDSDLKVPHVYTVIEFSKLKDNKAGSINDVKEMLKNSYYTKAKAILTSLDKTDYKPEKAD